MKKIIGACIILIAVLSVYVNIVFADDCAMGRTPEGIYPMTNEDIVMENEDIKVYPYEGRTECSFQFLNTGMEKDILMGFPCKHVPDSNIWAPENLVIRDFTAWDETGNLIVSEDKAVKPPRTFDGRFDDYSSWFIFKVHFKEGERKTIKNTYKFTMSFYSTGSNLTGYIIKTGSVWKDKIGYAKVTFYMPGLKPYCIDSLGGGSYFRFEQDKIIWERANFEPTEDLQILFTRYDELIKTIQDIEGRNTYIKAEKELDGQQSKINNMGVDELTKLLDFDYTLNGGLRLEAFERLIKLDPLHGNRIFMKIGISRASVNGICQNFENGAPQIFDGRTFVPLRFIIENFGGDVNWNGNLKEITINCNNIKMVMKIGRKDYLVNDKSKIMDAAPRIENGRTLVPLRLISESLGYEVKWNEKDKSILISYKRSISELGFMIMEEESVGNIALGTTDKDLTSMIGEAEKKSDPVVWGADGMEHQTWSYPSRGIELDMVRNDDGKQVINRITITKPCSLKTKKNIGIGSSKKDVLIAYKDFVSKEWDQKDSVLLGTIYGGIMMFLENDEVKEIYIGADSE